MLASTLVTLALVLLGYAAISRRVQGTIVTAPIVFVAAGFLASDACFGVLDFHADNHAVSLLAEATLAVVLFTDASRIDLRTRFGVSTAVPMRLLGIGLPLTIVAGLIAGVVVLPSLWWSRRWCWRSCSPRPTLRSAKQSSRTHVCPRASVRA